MTKHSQSVDVSTLRHLPTLANLSEETLGAIARLATNEYHAAHAEIVRHLDNGAEQAAAYYIVVSGAVRVTMQASNGRTLTYQILEAGDSFGEVAALDGGPRTASVIAETDVQVLKIGASDVDRLLHEYGDFVKLITDKLVRMNRWLTNRLFEYHAYDVRGRVLAELLREHGISSDGLIRVTDRDLASRVGTTRENVTRINKQLKEHGIIERAQASIKVLDAIKLQQLLAECEFS